MPAYIAVFGVRERENRFLGAVIDRVELKSKRLDAALLEAELLGLNPAYHLANAVVVLDELGAECGRLSITPATSQGQRILSWTPSTHFTRRRPVPMVRRR